MYRHTFHCILGCRHVEKFDKNRYSASWRPPVSHGGAGLGTSGFRPVWREMSWRVSHLVWRAAFFSSPCPYVYHCIKIPFSFFASPLWKGKQISLRETRLRQSVRGRGTQRDRQLRIVENIVRMKILLLGLDHANSRRKIKEWFVNTPAVK